MGSSGIWSVLSTFVRGTMLCMSCCLRAVFARRLRSAARVAASSSGVGVAAGAGCTLAMVFTAMRSPLAPMTSPPTIAGAAVAGTASGPTMPSRSWSIGRTPVVRPVPVPELTWPLASDPDVWLLGPSTLEPAVSAVVVSTVAVLLVVPLVALLAEVDVPVLALVDDVLPLSVGPAFVVEGDVLLDVDVVLLVVAEDGVVVAVTVLPLVPVTEVLVDGLVDVAVAVLPLVPVTEVVTPVCASAGKASASAETRGVR